MERLKIMTVVGTRPEIIRLSRVIARLDASEAVEHVLVHTGQNWDYELNQVFFDDLGLRAPDAFLEVAGDSLGQTLGRILERAETVLRDHRPDALLVLGDTNSALAAIMARRMKIPIYHMEAGNRSFDANVPEETNRRMVDHISDFNLAYTEHARRHLLAEGLPHRRTYVTGSPMAEVLEAARPGVDRSGVLEELGLEVHRYIVVSIHREENVDRSARLRMVFEGLNRMAEAFGHPIVVSLHPRTRKRIEALSEVPALHDLVRLSEPFGYFDYVRLQRDAFCTVSDSGTIAEESSLLGFPAVTPREAIERPEAMDTGGIVVTGLDPTNLVRGVAWVTSLERGDARRIPADYAITNVSERVVSLIMGTARLSNAWDGIRTNDLA